MALNSTPEYPLHVFVPIEAYRHVMGGTADPDEEVEYVEAVPMDRWTSDPFRFRNPDDSADATHVRISKEWAEGTKNLVPADED